MVAETLIFVNTWNSIYKNQPTHILGITLRSSGPNENQLTLALGSALSVNRQSNDFACNLVLVYES